MNGEESLSPVQERCSRWINNIERSLQLSHKLSYEEIRNIVDDMRSRITANSDASLVPFFREVEHKYDLRPSMHGDPGDIFGKALSYDSKASATGFDPSSNELENVLHLGVPRAAVQYWDAVRSGHGIALQTGVLSTNVCSLADAAVDITRTTQRDKSIVTAMAERHQRDISKINKKISMQQQRQRMYSDDPSGQWNTNLLAVNQGIETYSQDLTAADAEVQRLKQELAQAEQKKSLISNKLNTYYNISATAATKRRMLQIVTDLRLHVLERKKQRCNSRLQFTTRYTDFHQIMDEAILHNQFENDLPKLYSDLMQRFVSSSSVGGLTDTSTAEDIGQGVRVSLELLRLWRQLNGSTCSDALRRTITEHENALAAMQSKRLQKLPSPVARRGEYDNSTVFLYFNHIYHDTPAGHMESKRRMDTVVEKIIKREKVEKRVQDLHSSKVSTSEWGSGDTPSALDNTLKAAGSLGSSASYASPGGRGPYSDDSSTVSKDSSSSSSCLSSPDVEIKKVYAAAMDPAEKIAAQALESIILSQERKYQPPPTGNVNTRPSMSSTRHLSILQCSDVTRPPAWVLPLVHAPGYLNKLDSITDEAKTCDLLVPLEFDSDEYEVCSVDSESDVDETATPLKTENAAARESPQSCTSPTAFFSDALSLDRLGKDLLSLVEVYYPTGAVPGTSLKGNRANLSGGRPVVQYVKKNPKTNNLGRPRKIGAPMPKPVVARAKAIPATAATDLLPAKRRRQPKLDAAYYQSPVSKKPKAISMNADSLLSMNQPDDDASSIKADVGLPSEQKIFSLRNGGGQIATSTCSNNNTAPNNVAVVANENQAHNVAAVKNLLRLGVSKELIYTMFEVNTPILQKWIDESPADVNPDTFHRLSVKIDDWLSKLSSDDRIALEIKTSLPEDIKQKLFPRWPQSTSSGGDAYNSKAFLEKENLINRAEKLHMLSSSAVFSADVTFCHLMQSVLGRARLPFSSMRPIFAAAKKVCPLDPDEATSLLPRWISGDVSEIVRSRLALVAAAWLLSRQDDLVDAELRFIQKKIESLSKPYPSFAINAQSLSDRLRGVKLAIETPIIDTQRNSPTHARFLVENGMIEQPDTPQKHETITETAPVSTPPAEEKHSYSKVKTPATFSPSSPSSDGGTAFTPETNLSQQLFMRASTGSSRQVVEVTDTKPEKNDVVGSNAIAHNDEIAAFKANRESFQVGGELRAQPVLIGATHGTGSVGTAQFSTNSLSADCASKIKTKHDQDMDVVVEKVEPTISENIPGQLDDSRRRNRSRNGSMDSSSGKSVVPPVTLTPGGVDLPLLSNAVIPKQDEIFKADRIRADFNYGTCEFCGKKGQLLCCDSCSCSYHLKCCKPKLSEIPQGDYFCRPCRESGADQQHVVDEADKNDSLCGKWVLLWNARARRWVPTYVIQKHPSNCAYLCELWLERKQKRIKKQRWVDISGVRVLHASTSAAEHQFLDSERGAGKNDKKTSRLEPGDKKQEITLDTYIGADSVDSAYCAASIACKAVDIVMQNCNANAFCCIRPPGHHAGRYGFTQGCMSTGFCLLNNAAIAMVYARVKWGLERVAVVDIDVHHGNGTAEILKGDPRAFFACTHMIHGEENSGFSDVTKTMSQYTQGFYPDKLGTTEISDNFISIGIYPKRFGVANNQSEANVNNLSGPVGFKYALEDIIIPRLRKFDPQLLIISAGFDAYETDPVGGDMGLKIHDFTWATTMLREVMESPTGSGKGRIISLMEGGYDTNADSLGLAVCVDNHVAALQT